MPTATATKAPAKSTAKAPAKATTPKAKPVPNTAELEKEAIHALKHLIAADAKRTDALKAFAAKLVAIRQKLDDVAGTSQAYRDAAARIYAAAAIPTDAESSLQASIRYHIGNVLREVFTPAKLTAAGLSTETPLERARAARAGGATNQTQTEAERKAANAVVTPGEVTNGGGIPITQASVEVLPDSVVLASTSPPQVGRRKEKRDYTERPRAQIALPPKPVILIGHALDIVRAAVSIKDIPATDMASLRDMSRRMRLELDNLEAHLASIEKAPAKRAPAASKTTKAA